MKKYLIGLISLFLASNEIKSQTITSQPSMADDYSSVTGNMITITKPAGFPSWLPPGSWTTNSTSDGGKVPQARTSYFLEYGDGRFTTFESKAYTYLSLGSKTALLTTRGKYDTIHPHGSVTAHPIVPDFANALASQQILPSGKNIGIISDVGDLVANDTIQVVLTFKKTFSSTGKILFYYNSNMQAFGVINQNNNKIQPVNYTAGQTLSAVRTYQLAPDPNLNYTTPAQIQNHYVLSTDPNSRAIKYINSNYLNNGSNALVFELPAAIDNNEYNIFITLITNGTGIYNSEWSGTSLNAYIIPDSMNLPIADPTALKNQLGPISASLYFPIAHGDPNSNNPYLIRPHDPNYITADKKCINSCTPGQSAQTFNYRVHFQNDGLASAKKIEVTVYLHKKLDVSTSSFSPVSANVAGTEIKGGNFHVSSFQNIGDWNKVVFTLDTKIVRDGHVNLFGTKVCPNPETDIRTMGDVYFSVKSVAGSVPIYCSIASIVFDKEPPVVTRMNLIRCCKRLSPQAEQVPPRPFGKKGKSVKTYSDKMIDKRREVDNLRVNG